MRPLPSDLAKAKSLAVPVENLAVGPHHFSYQKIEMRVVDRPQMRITPRLGGGQHFLRAGSNRLLLRGGPGFHHLAILLHHAEAQADRLLLLGVIADWHLAGDLAALHRGFDKEIRRDTHLRDELQKHISVDASAALVVVLEKPASPRIGYMDPQFIRARLHRIGDIEFKWHIGVPPTADFLAVHRDFPDMAHPADVDQDPAATEVFWHFDRAHIGGRSFGPVLGIVPDIPMLFSPELVLPCERTRHAHLHWFLDSLKLQVPSSVQANLIAQSLIGSGLYGMQDQEKGDLKNNASNDFHFCGGFRSQSKTGVSGSDLAGFRGGNILSISRGHRPKVAR